jgi:hypothetical protein
MARLDLMGQHSKNLHLTNDSSDNDNTHGVKPKLLSQFFSFDRSPTGFEGLCMCIWGENRHP